MNIFENLKGARTMAKRIINTNLVAALFVVIAVLGYGLIGKAGTEPDAPPGDTMKTLQEVYDAVGAEGCGVSQREGYCKALTLGASSNHTFFTVESGKRFVLLKVHASFETTVIGRNWQLTVNDIELINGEINRSGGELVSGSGWEYFYKYEHDFPDRCVVLDAGETLKVLNNVVNDPLNFTLIGYFYDVP
jgi:hypothetical protein